MWQLASKKALRKTEDERRPSWAQRFQHIEPLTAIRLRYNADKSIWVQDHIQVKIEARFQNFSLGGARDRAGVAYQSAG